MYQVCANDRVSILLAIEVVLSIGKGRNWTKCNTYVRDRSGAVLVVVWGNIVNIIHSMDLEIRECVTITHLKGFGMAVNTSARCGV